MAEVEIPAWLLGALVNLTQLCTTGSRAKTIRVPRGPFEVLLNNIFVFQAAKYLCPYSTRRIISDLFPGLEYRHQYEELPVIIRRYAGKIIAWSKGWAEWQEGDLPEHITFDDVDPTDGDADTIYFYPHQTSQDSPGEMHEVAWEMISRVIYTAFQQLIVPSEPLMKISLYTLQRLYVYVSLPANTDVHSGYRDGDNDMRDSVLGHILKEEFKVLFRPYSSNKKKKKGARKKTTTNKMRLRDSVPREFLEQCITTLEGVFEMKVQEQIGVESVPRAYEWLILGE